ncbi:MAG: hypothetical protein IJU23_02960 [Proteobacteria bacterium]|nr:hypothetical protein [Pseudomonadota bacterium]
MISKRYTNNKGVVLVIVLLLLVAITMIALVAMKISRAENGLARAMQYNRQAAKATMGGSIYVQKDFINSASNIVQTSKEDALSKGINLMGNYTEQENAWKKQFGGGIFKSYFPTEITALSGLGPEIASTNGRLLGDLTKSTKQTAFVNNLTLTSSEVPGFSKGDSFCNASAYANSAAVFGKVPVIQYHLEDAKDEHGNPIVNNGVQVKINVPDRSHYLLTEVNSSIAGFKREMGTLDLGTVPCK